ncbi:hypothetical protein M436DRAFT_78162 [Aureobasidium namibiae CBS 147.97]|uniref:Uncharacterized protein n=1 Tax=Aureobasidium namibiae CBS 147.97 TaxID=1043004 RepID=A0A074X313_9PEZI
MSNDLSSILARHNLKGINVANFSPSSASSASSQRPSPQHQSYQYAPPPPQQPYQYPTSVPQPRAQYTWTPPQGGGGAAVRPSFAWPAPPQPRYTIDPRHYSYDIWGKAPVFSMDEEDEAGEENEAEGEEEAGKEEEAKADDGVQGTGEVALEGEDAQENGQQDNGVQEGEEAVAGMEEEVTAEGNAQGKEEAGAEGDADAAAGMEESIEAETTADEVLAEETVGASTQGENISLEGPEPELDAATSVTETSPDASNAEPPSDLPQDDASSSPDVLTTTGPPVEEVTAAAPTESTPGETDAEAPSELVASSAADAAAHKSESVPDADVHKEVDDQTDKRSIELADTSVEEMAATEEPVAEQPDEFSDHESRGFEPASEVKEEPVDPPQQLESQAEDIGTDDKAVAGTPEPSDGNPSSTDPIPEDAIAEDEPSDDIPEEPPSAPEVDAKTPETEPAVDTVSTESDDAGLVAISPESEHTPGSAPIEASSDPDETVQIIDAGNDGSTDDTAAIIVVVPPSDDTAAIIVPPPPPSPGPRVTIAEPIKPSKLSKKKTSSSKSSKSRSSERPKEKPVEIIQLREGKSKTISKAKSKKKSKSVSSKGGESSGPPPPPPPLTVVDVPPRAPSPPPNGHVIDSEDVEVEETKVINITAVLDDTAFLPEAECEAMEIIAAEEAPMVDVPDQGETSAETMEQKEEIIPANALLTPPEVEAIICPLENGNPGEGVEFGADAENESVLTPAEIDLSPPEANHTSEKPQADDPADVNPPQGLPPHTSLSDDGTSIAEPITINPENHNGPEPVTAKEQTQTASIAEPLVEENGETETPIPPNVESQVDEELESVDEPSEAVIEETVSSDDTHNGVDEAESQNLSIEPENPEGSIPKDAHEVVLGLGTVEPKPEENISIEETAPIADTEPASSVSMEESQPVSSEIVNEPKPTLMELAALVLSTEAALMISKTTAVPEAAPADTDVSTTQSAAVEEASDPVPEAIGGQDNDLNGQAVIVLLPDDEDTLDVPPEAPMPPEKEAPDANLEAGDAGEANQHQETEETSEQMENENIQPELSPKVVAPVEDEVGDREPKVKTEVSDSLDRNAETLVADVSRASATTGVLDEQNPEAGKLNTDALTTDAPEVSEPQTTVISSPAVEEPDAIQTVEAPQQSKDQDLSDANIDVVRQTDVPASEEEALADSVTDTEVHDLDTPVTEGDSGEDVSATSPASTPKNKTEYAEPAEELQQVALAEVSTEAEVAKELVTDDVEVGKLADNEAPTGPVIEEPANDVAEGVVASESVFEQVEDASKPFVVEPADSEARETPEKHVSVHFTESHNIEDFSEQSIEVALEYISGKEVDAVVNTINDTDNASTTTVGAGAQAEDHDLQLLSMPVLAEEAQAVEIEGTKTSQGAGEDISKSEKEEKTTKAAEPVDTPLLDETPESNEIYSPGEQPIPPVEESPTEPPELAEPEEQPEPVVSEEPIESERAAQPNTPTQAPSTEAEVLPGDSASQQSGIETLRDSEATHGSPLLEEPAADMPAPVEDAPAKQSSKVSFEKPPVAPHSREPVSPPRERRKSSKSSSSRHSSSRHKVKDVSSTAPDPKPAPPSTRSRRRSSTANAPAPGLFRTPSTTKPRPTRAELAEQAEMRRREAEIAAREQEVQRQLRRARKRAAVEEQERRLQEKEEELARLEAIEKEQKKARREEKKRRAQEALEQERAARERTEEEARQKEFERAERRRRRKEAEVSDSRRHREDRAKAHKQSTSHREPRIRETSPIPEPKVSRHRTEDIGAERRRSGDEYYIREVPAPSRDPEQRRHRRSTRRTSEKNEKPKKGFWKSILGRI